MNNIFQDCKSLWLLFSVMSLVWCKGNTSCIWNCMQYAGTFTRNYRCWN